jgi:hypothetical protein
MSAQRGLQQGSKVKEPFDVTVHKVGSLYRSEQFPALEVALDELARTNDKFISGKPKASAAYWAFRQYSLLPAQTQSK